jgi:hypothetical protein
LSAAEKRYFKNSAGTHQGQKNYLKLFNAIDGMDVYDEEKIRRKFKGEKFIRQLHVMKIYLQDAIMKSLRNFHAASSTSLKIKDLLKNIELYFDRELFALCLSETKKAEELARDVEDDITLLEVLNWKRKLAQQQSPGDFSAHSLVQDQVSALSRLAYHNSLWMELIDPANARRVSDVKPQLPPTLHSKVLRYHIQYRDAIRSGKNKEAGKSLNKLIDELERQPHRLKEDVAIYLTSLNNLISYLVFNGEIEEALQMVKKAKTFYHDSLQFSKNKASFRLILRTYNIELETYRDTESLEEAVALIKDIVTLVQSHRGKAPEAYLLSLWFQFAYIYFLRKEFKDALHWINEILNCSFTDKRKDLHLQAHLLNLMVHFELKNFFVMRYFVISTKRFFNRNTALLPYHRKVISFFIKISGAPESEHRLLFKKLGDELLSGAGMIPESELDYINWKKWIADKS